MVAAPQVTITTPVTVENQHVTAIAQNLNALGHQVDPSQVVGVTDQTPVPRSKELTEVGAEITGEDLTHLITTSVGLSGTTRTTKSSNPLRAFMNKLIKKKDVDQEIVEK